MGLLEDTRKIKCIWLKPESVFIVGLKLVTSIEVYPEPGQFKDVPWFAVYEHGVCKHRINAQTVAYVIYE